jgi:hypothetical protein
MKTFPERSITLELLRVATVRAPNRRRLPEVVRSGNGSVLDSDHGSAAWTELPAGHVR